MDNWDTEIDTAITEAEGLRKIVRRQGSIRVSSKDERATIKGTSIAWFRRHRPIISSLVREDDLKPVDLLYREILEASDRNTARSKYVRCLKEAKKEMVALRSKIVLAYSVASGFPGRGAQPPDFSPLISDEGMQAILARRWTETVICISAGAHLAATVMMGGLLEALLLARINRLSSQAKTRVFRAKTAPRNKSTGKALPLQDWTLRNFIDVAHELEWIGQPAKEVVVVLRDYRNYIHPYKELRHGIRLSAEDTTVLWAVFQSIATCVIDSV